MPKKLFICKKNTPEFWEEFWNSYELDVFDKKLLKEEYCIRFKRIEKTIFNRYNHFEGLKVIEIGAGSGTNALLMGKRGANVTILDFSAKALFYSQEVFLKNGINAEFVLCDALNLDTKLFEKYDICMSFGLSEHFSDEERFLINKTHFDLVKKGGMVFISVPNRLNPPYRVYKCLAERLGFWRSCQEFPYSRGEFRDICSKLDIQDFFFIGDSFLQSFDFINPFKLLRKLLNIKDRERLRSIKTAKGSFLDQFFSYALVLCAFKG